MGRSCRAGGLSADLERIDGPIQYLFLAATFLDARWAGTVENVSALVPCGIGLEGHRQLLAVTIGAEESEESWDELLAQLIERGLSGVQLVIADAHAFTAKAFRRLPPEAPQQRCVVALQRKVVGAAVLRSAESGEPTVGSALPGRRYLSRYVMRPRVRS